MRDWYRLTLKLLSKLLISRLSLPANLLEPVVRSSGTEREREVPQVRNAQSFFS